MRALRLPPSLLTLFLAGCQTQSENPLATASATPPPESAFIFTSDVYSPAPGAPREVFAAAEDGSGMTRLTTCNAGERYCDAIEAAPSPEGVRLAVRRVDTPNGGAALVFMDLSRSTEAELRPATVQVSGVDWAPDADVIVYSGLADSNSQELWAIEPRNNPAAPQNPHNNRQLTNTSDADERRPRIDPSGSVAAYERASGGAPTAVWIFRSGLALVPVTAGGTPGPALAGTHYVLGADADPDYSPDGTRLVFRRLTATGNGSLGSWDLMTVGVDGTDTVVVATGAAWRGAPDWGPKGILFPEIDPVDGQPRLVIVQPDGSGRRVAAVASARYLLTHPRWLRER